jgi:Fic family protein
LIDTLTLQEAKASSEVENIVTTQDELFQADLFPDDPQSPAAKEVARYRDALRLGLNRLVDTGGLIPNSTLIDMFRLLKDRDDGFRVTPGTALKNERNGDIVFVPPQDANEIVTLMTALERFVNDDALSDLDPMIKMALIHHQFESIHPFPDGNGRIGRILNVLYLTRTGLLDIPILYLSRHITRNKGDYYRLLQAVRDDGVWEEWLIFMLEGVAQTARTTLRLVEGIGALMHEAKHRMRAEVPKLYSQELLNNLFRHPYTRIEYVQNDLKITRQTAARYLDTLAEHGFVDKQRAGKNNYFINTRLVGLLMAASEED